MQLFDIRYFQDITQFAKERNIDSKKERILVRSSQNKLFIDGLKNPLIVANSPELKISYLGNQIPFSAKLSPLENLNRIEKFFNTHSKTTASVNWHNLIFGVPEVEAITLAGAAVAFATVTLLGMAFLLTISNSGDSKSKDPEVASLIGTEVKVLPEFACEDMGTEKFFMKRGKEKLSFEFKKNITISTGATEDIVQIEYLRDKEAETMNFVVSVGIFDNTSPNAKLFTTAKINQLKELIPAYP